MALIVVFVVGAVTVVFADADAIAVTIVTAVIVAAIVAVTVVTAVIVAAIVAVAGANM